MAQDAYKAWYAEGLSAVKTAAEGGKQASGGAHAQSAPPAIRAVMENGAKIFGAHADKLGQLLSKAGGGAGDKPNPFWDGIQKGSQQMIGAAGDDGVREASVVAAAQIATHYFIAAYGTLASNAKHLGLDDDAAMLKDMTDEMKSADEQMTKIAEEQSNRKAGSAA